MKLFKLIFSGWSKMKLKHSLLFGLIVGWLVYTITINRTYNRLEREIASVPIFKDLFKEDPAMLGLLETFAAPKSQQSFQRMTASEAKQKVFSWRMLMDVGVIENDKPPANISEDLNVKVISPLLSTPAGQLMDLSGVEIFKSMMSSLRATDNTANIGGLDILITKVLANAPGAYEAYVNAIEKEESAQSALDDLGFFRKLIAHALPRELASGIWGERASINQLIGVTMQHLQASELYENLDSPAINNRQSSQEEKEQVEEFARRVLIEITNSRSVTNARDWVLVFQGPMQLIMLITFCACMSLLLTKFSNRVLKEGIVQLTEDEERSRIQRKSTRNWMFKVLPIFGFIGTILGLMQALGDAYKIPLAQGSSSTAIAISEITAQLGIAFTTTLMAFTLTIVLGLLELIVDQYNIRKLQAKIV